MMRNVRHELRELPSARVGTEWHKLLMKGQNPSHGMEVMRQAGVLEALHPELHALVGHEQDPQEHPEGDVWEHTKLAADRASDLTRHLGPISGAAVRYAALLHNIGKPSGARDHHKVAVKMADNVFLNQIPMENMKEIRRRANKLLGEHPTPQALYERHLQGANVDGEIRRLALRLWPRPHERSATIRELIHLAHASHTGRGPHGPQEFPAGEWLLDRAKALGVASGPPRPYLTGQHLIQQLGMKGGPHVGQILRQVFDMQLDGKIRSFEDALQAAQELVGQRQEAESLYNRVFLAESTMSRRRFGSRFRRRRRRRRRKY
jgi:tRNA nucleotidyltransferase (CCA-adding enzyme)